MRSGIASLTVLSLLLASCGGGGSSGGGGGGPVTVTPTPTPTPTPTASCGLSARQSFAKAVIDEWYLFPSDVATNVNPANFADVQTYIDALVAPARALNKDRYFTYVTSIAEEDAFFTNGSSAGFGVSSNRVCEIPGLDCAKIIAVGHTAAISAASCSGPDGISGALPDVVRNQLGRPGFRPLAVLSGNRNFPGRVHPDLENGFLASPPLVIAFALAGTVNIDITREPVGIDAEGLPVMLHEIWPTGAEIDDAVASGWNVADFDAAYHEAATRPLWVDLDAPRGPRFPWAPTSTYLRRPPFAREHGLPHAEGYARPLIVLGDDVTTDHISPANQIRLDSAAGRHIVAEGGDPADLNVFASRRGNFEVMIRGAFTNRLAVNRLIPADAPAGYTRHEPSGDIMPLIEAAERYARTKTPLVLVAGERYGMGSSRDWAAKAVALLGVRAVIASSIERIHRTNLIGMGILPLLLPESVHPDSLNIRAEDLFDLGLGPDRLTPRCEVPLTILRPDREPLHLTLRAAIETSLEVTLLKSGGLIPHVLGELLGNPETAVAGVA